MELKQKKLDCNDREYLFYEINKHLLTDEKPSIYLESILEMPFFREHPFYMLCDLKKAEQSPVHHGEGNAWVHTMLVTDYAASEKHRSKNEAVFMWAALLHDIGKPPTTKIKKGKITSYDHEKVGAVMAREFLKEFFTDSEFINEVCALVRWHMQILHVVKDMPFADIKAMKEEADINEVALLGFCDRMGRKGSDIEKERQNISMFLEKCNKG
ncbi:MAG TPA: phosphohydrolase [Clostridiales bacterium]|nr:phosphohydrolase [Clostridiales bacterium]